MSEWIGAAEAARRARVSKEWIIKLCQKKRIPGARKLGPKPSDPWLIPPGAKIEPTGLGRPLRTLEIPKSKGGKR
ncbi:MAG: DNA-binding protein [Pseudomonadota bacterium]|nr:DNA-binding protein [Pseudomonadota bacterium]